MLGLLMERLAPRVLQGRRREVERIVAELVREHPGAGLEALWARVVSRAGRYLALAPSSHDLVHPPASSALERRWRLAFELDRAIPPQIHDGLPVRWSLEPLSRETVLQWWATWIERRDSGRAPSRLQAYVHVPWCRTRCGFCQYEVELARDGSEMEHGVRTIEDEARAFRTALGPQRAHAATVGGGTPSALPPALLARVLDAFLSVIERDAAGYFSIELNPDSCDADKLRIMHERGVNRVSLGVQSFHPPTLRAVQRGYQTDAMVETAVRDARRFDDLQISLDLLAPLQSETEASFERGARRAFELEPDQLVLYRYEPVIRGDVRMEPGDLRFAKAREVVLEQAARRGYRRIANTGSSVVVQHPAARELESRYLQHDRAPSSLLGLGPFAESHVFDVGDYVGSSFGDPHPYHGHALAPGEERARFIGRRLGGALPLEGAEYRDAFASDLEEDFAAELAFIDERAAELGDPLELKRTAWLFLDPQTVEAIGDSRPRGMSDRGRRWMERTLGTKRHLPMMPMIAQLVDVEVGARLGATDVEPWVSGRVPLEVSAAHADSAVLCEHAHSLGLGAIDELLARAWIEGSVEAPRIHVIDESVHTELRLVVPFDALPLLVERLGADPARLPSNARATALWIHEGQLSVELPLSDDANVRARIPEPMASAVSSVRVSLHARGITWIASKAPVTDAWSRRMEGLRVEARSIELSGTRLDDAVVVVSPRTRRLAVVG